MIPVETATATARPGPGATSTSLSAPATIGLTVLCLVIASAASLLVALTNLAWFAIVNGVLDLQGAVARGLLYSSWLLLLGGLVVIRRPRAFGFREGALRRRWRLVVAVVIPAMAATALILRIIGATPYSDASLFIESVVVPFTEELVFRAVLLTVLLLVLRRLQPANRARILAILFCGVAFGIGHLANATSVAFGFVIGQSLFAMFLGAACAFLMARTRSVYPAMILHSAVNAVVVVAS